MRITKLLLPFLCLAIAALDAARALCPVGYSVCDSTYCISHLSTCCASGNGASCPYGYDCTPDAMCCPQGEPCSVSTGSPARCAGDNRKMCGGLCVPDDAVCCGDDGTYCYAGQQCVANGGGCSGAASGLGAGPVLALGNGITVTTTVGGGPTGGVNDDDDDDDDDTGAVGNLRVDGALLGAGVMGVVIAML